MVRRYIVSPARQKYKRIVAKFTKRLQLEATIVKAGVRHTGGRQKTSFVTFSFAFAEIPLFAMLSLTLFIRIRISAIIGFAGCRRITYFSTFYLSAARNKVISPLIVPLGGHRVTRSDTYQRFE